jgi:RNA polymerase-interacting CarD/CdnL/TRCF family regulator
MAFQPRDRVVHPAYGVGSIRAVVTESFPGSAPREYYQIDMRQGTIWIPVDDSASTGLRALTTKAELARWRRVLSAPSVALNPDARQRRQELLDRVRTGQIRAWCEVVRDLTALGRTKPKPLADSDSMILRQAKDGLCREWADADGISIEQAIRAVDTLLSRASASA